MKYNVERVDACSRGTVCSADREVCVGHVYKGRGPHNYCYLVLSIDNRSTCNVIGYDANGEIGRVGTRCAHSLARLTLMGYVDIPELPPITPLHPDDNLL